MSLELWTDVDRYFNKRLLPNDPILTAALESSEEAGLPRYAVAPNQGKLLSILAQGQGARNILEIGTLGGYSTIWLARSLAPGGRLITLEANATYAGVARANLERAGLERVVEVRLGEALNSLPQLVSDGPFDLILIDADKPNIPEYFKWAIELSRQGSLIVVDNVGREGEVARLQNEDPEIVGVRRLADMLATEPRVRATAIQTVGSKGHDGFLIAVVDG